LPLGGPRRRCELWKRLDDEGSSIYLLEVERRGPPKIGNRSKSVLVDVLSDLALTNVDVELMVGECAVYSGISSIKSEQGR